MIDTSSVKIHQPHKTNAAAEKKDKKPEWAASNPPVSQFNIKQGVIEIIRYKDVYKKCAHKQLTATHLNSMLCSKQDRTETRYNISLSVVNHDILTKNFQYTETSSSFIFF